MHARIRGSSDCNRACTVGLPGAAFLHINAGQENQLEALNATWWGQLSLRALSSVLRQEGEKTSHQDLSRELRLRVALPRVGVDPID